MKPMLVPVGIIGYGFNGKATARMFEATNLKVHDTDQLKSMHSFDDVMAHAKYLFLCVPETALHTVVAQIEQHTQNWMPRDGLDIFVRSTCPVGTTSGFNLATSIHSYHHFPEFFTEKWFMLEARTRPVYILGRSERHMLQFHEFHHFVSSHLPGTRIIEMQTKESELAKLALNAFMATKVTFFNEIAELAEAHCLDFDNVVEGMLQDGRIGKSHYHVPGWDGKYGYGGSCFPKDMAQLIQCFDNARKPATVLKAVTQANERHRAMSPKDS